MKFAIEKISTNLTDGTRDEYALSQHVGGGAYIAICFGTTDELLKKLGEIVKANGIESFECAINGKTHKYCTIEQDF